MMIVLKKIWFWVKKLFWLLFIVAGLIFASKALRSKDKQQEDIERKIREIEKIENKTEEDRKKLEELKEEKKKVEKEIIDITEKYRKKVEEAKAKPDAASKPGDAGRSADDLKDVW